jgi:hypothetical protein
MPQYADINAEFFVRGAARQAAQILDDYRTAVKQTNADPMIPAGGKLFRAGELQKEAIGKLEALKEQTELAAILYNKEAAHKRDQARPVIPSGPYDRYVRRFTYLLDRGLSVEALVGRYKGDARALRVLQNEYEAFAWGENPENPKAPEAVGAIIDQAAYESFGSGYQDKVDTEKRFERGAYRVMVAINQAQRVARRRRTGRRVLTGLRRRATG